MDARTCVHKAGKSKKYVGPKLRMHVCMSVCTCVCVCVAKIDSRAAGPIKLTAFESDERDSCVSGTGSSCGSGSGMGRRHGHGSQSAAGYGSRLRRWRGARVVLVDVVWSTNLAPASHRISNCWQFVSGKKRGPQREPNIQIEMLPHATHTQTNKYTHTPWHTTAATITALVV